MKLLKTRKVRRLSRKELLPNFFFFLKSIIIDSFVGKENRNYSTIHKEIILALNLYCNILNSFVLPSGMLLRFFPTKLSGAERKIHTIEKVRIQS